jgi:hypothetical protein
VLSSPSRKNILLKASGKSRVELRPSRPRRGTLAIVTNVGRDAVDACGAADECTGKRTAKSCGPDIPTLISGATRERCHPRRQQSPVSGASTKEAVKTIAQGRPERSGEPVATNSYAFYFCIRGCGCIGHPVFPAPSISGAALHRARLGRIVSREARMRGRRLAPVFDSNIRNPSNPLHQPLTLLTERNLFCAAAMSPVCRKRLLSRVIISGVRFETMRRHPFHGSVI